MNRILTSSLASLLILGATALAQDKAAAKPAAPAPKAPSQFKKIVPAMASMAICETGPRFTMSSMMAAAITVWPTGPGCTASLIIVQFASALRLLSVSVLSGDHMSTKPSPRTCACSRSHAP